ncbi:hypothetical protein QYE77_14565 [Thermanaerothrix sp. 4228-RoL]|uniref:Uncharacterized protein n=1 Tax=Thermanaerothrix solaris TaxID=3058434 RepID=A0ABU3NSV4_9CHLR|nr:hypothetical protein [Thermanaerothrix sp. 4228-RoL]MDT8899485.1 hypothetical protein [Thermanaerothrix sp. 4228-RoL]
MEKLVLTPAFTPAFYASVYAGDYADVERQRLRQRLIVLEALQGVCFCGVAMSVSPWENARSECV